MIETHAFARAGFLGNPSDGYFGKTISITVRNFGAHVILYESPELRIEAAEQDRNVFRNIDDFLERVALHGYYGGDRLVKAAIKRFADYCIRESIILHRKSFSIRYRSTVPRQIGLAGSSAIVTAVMRALSAYFDVTIPQEIMPTLILEAETEELGINAGLQDRVIQVYEGCVYMDFDRALIEQKGHGLYERIDPSLLPGLFLAFKTELGKVSGRVLNDIRVRYERKEPLVIETLSRIADLATEGRKALEAGDFDRLHTLVNENFDLRSRIMDISPGDRELVETARHCGAAAKFAGSGGSIIGIYEGDAMLTELDTALKQIGARVVRPFVV